MLEYRQPDGARRRPLRLLALLWRQHLPAAVDELGVWEARAESNAATARRCRYIKGGAECAVSTRGRLALSVASGTGTPLKPRKATNCLVLRNVHPSGTVAGKRALVIRNQLPRGVGAPDRVLPCRGRHRSADSFIGLSLAPTAFWGHGCGCILTPESKKCPDSVLGGNLGSRWRCSN
jgi:hypothetical protein